MNNGSKPANPAFLLVETGEHPNDLSGLTKREMFAMAAMQAIIPLKGVDTWNLSRNEEGCTDDIAMAAVRCADELLKALEP